MSLLTSRAARVSAVVLLQLSLVGVAFSGQLSARLTGDEYLFRVEPVDPMDPFRGAYVALTYPDLLTRDGAAGDAGRALDETDQGDVYLPLARHGEFWRATGATRERPSKGPYLSCSDRDWQIKCGIESWFLPQDKARDLENAIREGDVVARVKIDDRGNAALVGVEMR